MGDQSLAEIAGSPDKEHDANSAYRVLYDGQCEICQSCVSWLKHSRPREQDDLSAHQHRGLVNGRFPAPDG